MIFQVAGSTRYPLSLLNPKAWFGCILGTHFVLTALISTRIQEEVFG